MAFQFTCPQGHLLTADERQAGQQRQCPDCGQWLMIPGVTAPPPNALPDDLLSELPAVPTPFESPTGGAMFGGGGSIGGMAQPHLMHIPCPNGHPYKAPIGQLGTRIACPICSVPFELKHENSVEYREHQERLEEARFSRSGTIWLRWAIAFAVLVVAGLVAIAINSNPGK